MKITLKKIILTTLWGVTSCSAMEGLDVVSIDPFSTLSSLSGSEEIPAPVITAKKQTILQTPVGMSIAEIQKRKEETQRKRELNQSRSQSSKKPLSSEKKEEHVGLYFADESNINIKKFQDALTDKLTENGYNLRIKKSPFADAICEKTLNIPFSNRKEVDIGNSTIKKLLKEFHCTLNGENKEKKEILKHIFDGNVIIDRFNIFSNFVVLELKMNSEVEMDRATKLNIESLFSTQKPHISLFKMFDDNSDTFKITDENQNLISGVIDSLSSGQVRKDNIGSFPEVLEDALNTVLKNSLPDIENININDVFVNLKEEVISLKVHVWNNLIKLISNKPRFTSAILAIMTSAITDYNTTIFKVVRPLLEDLNKEIDVLKNGVSLEIAKNK